VSALVSWGGDPMPEGVTITPAAPAMLSRYAARRLTDAIRGKLEDAARGLIRAWQGAAHEALGYGEGAEGWQAYVDAEFGDLRLLSLPAEARDELMRSMTDAGFTRRQVAKGTGSSVGAVSHAVKGRPVKPVEHLDEHRDSPQPVAEPPAGISKRARALQLVAEQGERGLTALELAEVTGWTGGSASGTMSDLKRQGRVVAVAVFRRGFAAHVIIG
jgi:hypothetical protein